MPLTRRGIFQFGVLLLCVPAQYYLSGLSNDSSSEYRQQSILNIIGEFQRFRESWFSFQAWKDTYMKFVVWIVRDLMNLAEGDDESLAIEVLQYREQLAGEKSGDQRPSIVHFRVGQVVGNLQEGYKGVVIGWRIDTKVGVPTYTILVDEGESVKTREPVEISQDKLYGVENSMVKNRLIKHYFYTYDGSQYVPLPWLKEKYPKD